MLSTSPVFQRTRWARRALFATAIVDLLLLMSGGLSALLGATAGAMFEEALAFVDFVLTIVGAVSFLMWTYSFIGVLNAMKVGLSDTAFSAMLWWFVPLANLFRPYQILRDALVALGSRKLVHEARLAWWWWLFLVSNFAAFAFGVPLLVDAAAPLNGVAALLGARMLGLAATALRDYSTPDIVVDALPLETRPVRPAANG